MAEEYYLSSHTLPLGREILPFPLTPPCQVYVLLLFRRGMRTYRV